MSSEQGPSLRASQSRQRMCVNKDGRSPIKGSVFPFPLPPTTKDAAPGDCGGDIARARKSVSEKSRSSELVAIGEVLMT
jgi:hypothetical protein